MRTITILYDGSFYTFRWLKALLWANKQFKDNGILINFPSMYFYLPFMKSNKDIVKVVENKDFDILMVAFHHSTTELGRSSKVERCRVLKLLKKHCNHLIWMDTADSTGTCLFDVMPYVDIYMKKQILRNKSLYLKEYYGGGYVYQYYHEKYNLEDNSLLRHYEPAREEDLSKIKVSWSIGLSDLFTKYKIAFLRPLNIKVPHGPILKYDMRKYDMFFRGTSHSEIVGWQRHKCSELLMSFVDITHPNASERVSPKEYKKEFKNSKSALSPYGWGEVCFRDFEAFGNSTTLIKPDMSHCETYPNLYKQNETYISIDWDFSNLREIVDDFKSNPSKYEEIAMVGHDVFLSYIKDNKAKEMFVKHFISQISTIVDNH